MDLMQDLVVNKTCIDLAPKIGEFGPSDLSEQIIEVSGVFVGHHPCA